MACPHASSRYKFLAGHAVSSQYRPCALAAALLLCQGSVMERDHGETRDTDLASARTRLKGDIQLAWSQVNGLTSSFPMQLFTK